MDMIFHTAEEIISLGNVEKRWSIGYEDLAHIVILNKITVFSCHKIRKTNSNTLFVGLHYIFESCNDNKVYYSCSNKKDNNEKDEIGLEQFYWSFEDGGYDWAGEEMHFFLLTAEVRKFEIEHPYLLGKKLEGQEAQEAFQQTVQADSPLSDLQPMLSPIGRQSEESDDARVAELEALARKRAARGLDTEQAEELEKVRKELEAEKASHARTRKELEEKIKRLELQLAEKDQGQGVDETKTKFDVEPTGKNRGSYLAIIDALRSAVTIKDKDLASWLENKIAGLGYDSPKAQAIRIIMKDVEEHRKEKVLLPQKR